MMLATNDTTSGNLRISTSKCFKSFFCALAVTILHRSRTALRLRKYPAGSSCGSGGLGMSILAKAGFGPGEKGVSGVPGPAVLVVPADVLLMTRVLVLMGLTMLEEPDVSDDLDCDDDSVCCGFSAVFGALSLLENRPIAVFSLLRSTVRGRRLFDLVIRSGRCPDSSGGLGAVLVALRGKLLREEFTLEAARLEDGSQIAQAVSVSMQQVCCCLKMGASRTIQCQGELSCVGQDDGVTLFFQ